MKNIIWLASYPKSGNTWLRIFLSNLLTKTMQPININSLIETPLASSRLIFDYFSGVNSSDLERSEIENIQPEIYKQLSESSKNDIYLKVHDAWRKNDRNQPLFPEEISKGVLYIIRNPLDVVISYASHNNATIEKTIENLNNPEFGISVSKSKLQPQLYQKISSWSEHVISWTKKSELPVHIIKYEDMISDPFGAFKQVTHFLNIERSEPEIKRAIEFSSFEELQKQESQFGFKEKPINSEAFFKNGKSGVNVSQLSNFHKMSIWKKHFQTMDKYGYFVS